MIAEDALAELYKFIGDVTLVDLKAGELLAFKLKDVRKELEKEILESTPAHIKPLK